jgi:hypothetical protein
VSEARLGSDLSSVIEGPATTTGVTPPALTPVRLTKQQWPLQRDCPRFYGNPGEAGWLHAYTTSVAVPWRMFMGSTPIDHILIHKRCAPSLERVLAYTWDRCGRDQDKVHSLHFDRYDGSYNFRPMRGGASLSMHAYAVAIDWDAAANAHHSQTHFFTKDTILIDAFLQEGWEWGGSWGGGSIDAMHVQAAHVHGG